MADNLNELPSLYTVTGDIKDINTLLISREAVRLNAQGVPDTREMFNAGWCAAARFCDREDAVYDGLVGPGGCPAFEVAYRAALSAAPAAPAMNKEQNMNIEQERAEFEAWYRLHHGSLDVYGRDASGEYADKQVQSAFNVWQARAALAAQPAASAAPREVDMNEYRAMVAAMEQIDPATLPGLTAAQRCALGRFAKPAVSAGDALPTVHRTAPERSYLCIGDEAEQRDEPFDELADITWSSDQPVDVAVPYVRADLLPQPAAQQGDALSYVHPVPDHCDRVVWRNRYLHLAAQAQEAAPAAPGEPSAWHRIKEDAEVDVPLDTDLLLAWWDEWSEAWKIEVNYAGSERGGWRHGRATHWMPLPAPPSAEQQKGASNG